MLELNKIYNKKAGYQGLINIQYKCIKICNVFAFFEKTINGKTKIIKAKKQECLSGVFLYDNETKNFIVFCG